VPNVQWKTPDDGQRKHVEFLDKNKFGKVSASVGFIKKKRYTENIASQHTSLARGEGYCKV
jgi:hypothetical protein